MVGGLALEALPKSIVSLVEREAERRGSTAEALTVQLLLRIAEESEKPRLLLDAARALLEHARRLAERGDYGEACRKLWSSVLLALDAYAAATGVRQPEGFHDYVKICEEAGREEPAYMDGLYAGIAALVLWKEGIASPGHCTRIAGHVETLLGKVGEAIG